METETLDRLYLEWSQFTAARTARELAYRDKLIELLPQLSARDARLVRNMLKNFGDDDVNR